MYVGVGGGGARPLIWTKCNIVDNKLIIVGCPSCNSILTYVSSDVCGP